MAGGGLTGTLFREKDWSKSPLGPVESWPQSLLTMVSLMMDSSFPMSLWWGPELYMLYNDGYAPIAGDRHPHLFGNRAKDHWYELLPILEPLIADVYKGQSVYNEDQMLVMHRHGYVEVATITSNLTLGNILYLVGNYLRY